jgi:uncharacterized membrane protein
MAADDERPGPGADPRTLALSDGVFAIAMTLLVLSIGMPRPGQQEHLPLSLLVGGWALLLWLLLPFARRA